MKPKKISAIIEASTTGFGVYVEDDNLPLNGYGKTVEAAKEDIKVQLKEMLDYYEEMRKPIPLAYNRGNLEFVYKYDITSIFHHFGVLDATRIAKRIGMNASLLRQYKAGLVVAGKKQKKKIEECLHSLGRELLSVRL